MDRIPLVRDFMTKTPRFIGIDQRLPQALARMRKLGVRHLPVLDAGVLIGVLSERDAGLAIAAAPELAATMRVEEAMSAIPYCVSPETPLREVAEHLAARKLGCAVVTNDAKVVGLLTTTDALRALGEVLEAREDEPPAPALAKVRAPITNPLLPPR